MKGSVPPDEEARLAALHGLGVLDKTPEPEFDRITRLAAHLLNAPIALMTLVGRDQQWIKSHFGLEPKEAAPGHAFYRHAMRDDDILVVNDAAGDPRFANNPLVTGEPSIRFYAGAPLRTPEGDAIGVLCIIDRSARATFSPEQQQILRSLAGVVMAQIEARRAMGYVDRVTGLPNRFRLLHDVGQLATEAEASGRTFAVVVIKTASPGQYAELVRTLGHTIADSFDIGAAQTVRGVLPAEIEPYHLIGSRFACVVRDGDEAKAEDLARHLAADLAKPILLDGIPFTTSKGIGIAEFPKHGRSAEEIVRAATSAAHQALEEREAYRIHGPAWDEARNRTFTLLRDLTVATGEGRQLRVEYQPKIDLRTNRCIGAEALLRWDHPQLGPISPGEFVPLFERTSNIHRLTQYAIEDVLTQVRRWRTDGLEVCISINISGLDLLDDDFDNRLSSALKKHKVQPDWIDIELTETARMDDPASIGMKIQKLRDIGIDIGIDDFGTGQSALSYLKYIPASFVKIDSMFIRSLEQDENDRIMVRSTIDMAHALQRRVVAEGIESQVILDWLRGNGCDHGQGFAISAPLRPEAFARWVRDRT
ncbi:EAL domain-containing protein [Roseomonas sp. HJA6]|uniref:EAL domain-containing protein n=1 Tax=Roseomonas alba TaxID=2846776 RepID=A0ABS7A2R0_9PROT|nr:EAL domain-containing protein [Neoroseomonas alba]MBW6396569.1 EAL domain-containing protein [Neoroseomonas alba]